MTFDDISVGVPFGCSKCGTGRITEVEIKDIVDGCKVTCVCGSVVYYTRLKPYSQEMRVLAVLHELAK